MGLYMGHFINHRSKQIFLQGKLSLAIIYVWNRNKHDERWSYNSFNDIIMWIQYRYEIISFWTLKPHKRAHVFPVGLSRP